MTTNDSTDLRSRIWALAEEVIADRELYVVDVQVRGQQGSRVVELFVDSDSGVGLDDLAGVSRELSFLLDTEDVVKGRYNLNVSSPGVDAPLRLARQYHRHVGRALRVVTTNGEESTNRTGTLAAVHDDAFELDVDGQTETIAFADVQEARVQLPW
jgi:ribosome maturation factor RimP